MSMNYAARVQAKFQEAYNAMFGERDGRLKHRKIGEVYGAAGPLHSRLFEPIFCYCGAPGGYVTRDTPIIYVCQKCTATYGTLPLPMIPGTENL